jgi:hypothetical protein
MPHFEIGKFLDLCFLRNLCSVGGLMCYVDCIIGFFIVIRLCFISGSYANLLYGCCHQLRIVVSI